jgi:CRP/FNR family transcriptional regulator
MNPEEMKELLPKAEPALIREILDFGLVKDLPAGQEVLREGQYVQMVPIVLNGLIRVYQAYEDKELLLYYIRNSESCIMSFNCVISKDPSSIYAVTELPTRVLLLPDVKVREWITTYASFSSMFFELYDKRYDDLLETIHQVIFKNLDERLLDYLSEKARIKEHSIIEMRHWQIANELGTSREVISRIIKKLERKGLLKQLPEGIEIDPDRL